MTTHISRMMALAVFAGLVVGGTGCKCVSQNECSPVCKENTEAGLPMIQCQPLDATVTGKEETAVFNVNADGKDLAFQWYRDGRPLADTDGFQGAKKQQLLVSDVPHGKVGNYFCRIISTDSSGFPINTDTRMATLGFVETKSRSTPPVQHQPLPPGSSGTSTCGVYCAYVLFPAGFKPATGHFTASATVRFSNSMNCLPVTSYNLFWQVNALEKGCATNSSDIKKSFPCNAAKTYKFIVYFTGNTWPFPGTAGAEVLLDVN